jgi:hypothetical protein
MKRCPDFFLIFCASGPLIHAAGYAHQLVMVRGHPQSVEVGKTLLAQHLLPREDAAPPRPPHVPFNALVDHFKPPKKKKSVRKKVSRLAFLFSFLF